MPFEFRNKSNQISQVGKKFFKIGKIQFCWLIFEWKVLQIPLLFTLDYEIKLMTHISLEITNRLAIVQHKSCT